MQIGERIELRRRQRGMSRRTLAQLVGRSEEWLRQIENGQRDLPGLELTVRLAEVLRFRGVDDLLGRSQSTRRIVPPEAGATSDSLWHAVLDHPAVDAYPLDHGLEVAAKSSLETSELAIEVEKCWEIWSDSPERYSTLTVRLPGLLARTRSVRWSTQTSSAGRLLVETYHLARHLLAGIGDHQLAWLVADRAMGTAALIGDRILVAASAWHTSAALTALDFFDECWEYATAAARQLDELPESLERISLSGSLHLIASLGAAGGQDGARAYEAMETAAAAAEALGRDQAVGRIWFGPTEIVIGRIQVALRLGKLAEAVGLAGAAEIPPEYPGNRRARHYLTAAYAFAQYGDDGAAVLALLRAEQACREDIHYDWLGKRTLQHLIRRGSPLVRAEVRRLALAAGLT